MIEFKAVGDIMLSAHRGTGLMINQNGPDYPFEEIRSTLNQADLLFGNLECPISDRGVKCSTKNPHITFRADPDSVKGLISAGFHVLSLANNHCIDYGEQALLDTTSTLEQAGIEYTGVYTHPLHPGYAVIRKNGITVAFIAYNSLPVPTMKSKGSANLKVRQLTLKNIRRDIQQIKTEVSPDIIITSAHWGVGYCRYPVPFQMEYAREMIDCGARIVLGHHPHIIQGIEEYKSGMIIYSLGDFIFDEPYPDTKESFIFSCTLSKEGFHDVEYIPVISNETYQPVLAKGERKEEILQKINQLSEEYQSSSWIHSPVKNPTEAFFLRKVKGGLLNRNLLSSMEVFPRKYLLIHSVPILLSKILRKAVGVFKQK